MKSIQYSILAITCILLFSCHTLFSQGKIMLVGGGSEDAFSSSPNWSNTPYQWVVEQSGNKRVAIITFTEDGATSFLPSYFEDLGAVKAKNFVINTREQANAQATFDSLMSYDAFFFKGGDQANYYETYRNTKVSEAMRGKYASGGVLSGTSAGMAILSAIVFTAENGSVYPDQVLQNIQNDRIVLKDDFPGLLGGYIADTHFIERGRFARLMGFLGKWRLDKGESVGGIGVDDQTAFCIDEDLVGTAYGNGAVSIYHLGDFSTNQNRPVADSIQATHLIHGKRYNLKNRELLDAYSEDVAPAVAEESGDYILYLMGTAPLEDNTAFMADLADTVSSQIAVISKNPSGIPAEYAGFLSENSGQPVRLITTSSSQNPCEGALDRNFIREARAFVFVGNEAQELMEYFRNHPTGQLLEAHLRKSGSHIAFAGEEAKVAGAVFMSNNTSDPLNAFYGDLEFENGLSLLETTTLVANAYSISTADYYENNAAGVKHAMLAHKLKHGLYINRESMVKFYQEDGRNWLNSVGAYSSVLATNQSLTGGLATEEVNSNGDRRMVVGFESFRYSLLSGNPQPVGAPSTIADPEISFEVPSPRLEGSITPENQIQLNWSVEGGNIDGFKLERSVNGGAFGVIAEPSASATAYTDTDVDLSNAYKYRMQAYSEGQTSCYSEETEALVITSIEQKQPLGFTLLNPVRTGFLQLKDPEKRTFEITILTLDGRVLLQHQAYRSGQRLDLPTLSQGLYLLKVKYQDAVDMRRLLVAPQ